MKKQGLVADPIVEARPRHRLPPSRTVAPLLALGRILMPAYMRVVLHYAGVEVRRPEAILAALRDFQEHRTRLLVAFRHAYGDESQLLFHVFDILLPRLARRLGAPLPYRPHLRVLHDYAVPLWGDAFIRFLLPRVGALPIYHVKYDSASLRTIRSVLLDDPCPIGLAPEGQVSYRGETLPRIEQGTVRMGFWCARDLARDGRPERAVVLPLGIRFRYDRRDAGKVRAMLDRIEDRCGIARAAGADAADLADPSVQARLVAVEVRMLERMEAFFTATYARPPARPAVVEAPPSREERRRRWETLMDLSLEVAERALGLPTPDAETERIQRVYRVRQECWDRIHPETPVEGLPPLDAALAHRRTGEAWYAMRNMEFVDLMEYLDPDYLEGRPGVGPTYDRTVETVINLTDLVQRLMGGSFADRPNVVRKTAVIVPGPCLDLSARLADERRDARRAAREATAELERLFLGCIEESLVD